MTTTAITGAGSDLAVDPTHAGLALRFTREIQGEAATESARLSETAEAAAAEAAVDIRLSPEAATAIYGGDPQAAALIAGADEVGLTVHKLIPADKAGFRRQAMEFAAAAWTQTGVPGFRTALQNGQVVIYTVDEMPAGLNVQAPVTLTSYAAGFRQASVQITPPGYDHAVHAEIAEGWNLQQGHLPEGGFFAVWPKG